MVETSNLLRLNYALPVGLSSIQSPNLLIKQVVRQLSVELPQLSDFVTLSPLPLFNTWLADQTEDPIHGAVASAILAGTAGQEDTRVMAARYLLDGKDKNGAPFDPVARFHLGNGAEVHDVHANADSSANGLAQSSGAMVNYLYDLGQVERNHEDFALRGQITTSRSVRALARTPFKAKSWQQAS